MTQQYIDPFAPFWELHFIRLLLHWQGSIFQFFWIEFVVVSGICAIILASWYYSLDDTHDNRISEAYESVFLALQYIHSRYQSAISLMLGFYSSAIFGRWWQARKAEAAAAGAVKELALQIAVLITDQKAEDNNESLSQSAEPPIVSPSSTVNSAAEKQQEEQPREFGRDQIGLSQLGTPGKIVDSNGCESPSGPVKAADVQLALVRWLNLSHALVVGELYEKKSNFFNTIDSLRDIGLLTDDEFDYMSKTEGSGYGDPLLWFLDTIRQLRDESMCGVVDGTIVITNKNIGSLRAALDNLTLFKSTPVPLSYRQLVNLTVRLYMVITFVYISINDAQRDEDIGFSEDVYYLLIPFCFEYFCFVGWLSVADSLANPFRVWADGFDWEDYVLDTLRESTKYVTETARASPNVRNLRGVRIDTSTLHNEFRGCRKVKRNATGF